MLESFGKKLGATALATTPFALRKKLLTRKLTKATTTLESAFSEACNQVQFYRERWGTSPPPFRSIAPIPVDATAQVPWRDLLLCRSTASPTFLLEGEFGTRSAISTGDLQNLGFYALLHPETPDLVSALRINPAACNGVPLGATLLGPSAERLLRFLGGSVLNLQEQPTEKAAIQLLALNPSVIAAPANSLLAWIAKARELSPSGADRLVDGIKVFIHMGSSLPMSPAQTFQMKKAFDFTVVDRLTDGVTTALFSCQCGAFHPAPHLHLEVTDSDGAVSPLGLGALTVSDTSREVAPVLRQKTAIAVDAHSEGCPFFNQTVNLVPRGLVHEMERLDGRWVGIQDIATEVFALGLVEKVTWSVGPKMWVVRVTPFGDKSPDREQIRSALNDQFHTQIRLEITK